MNFRGKAAIYMQIIENVCEKIIKEKLTAGDRIRSIRDEAVRIGVNPNTMARSYQKLQELGVIELHRGMGYFISSKGVTEAKRFLRDRFEKHELPPLFRAMETLEITLDEIGEAYENYKKEKTENESDEKDENE